MSERLERRAGVVVHTLPDERKALVDADRGVMLVVNPMGAAIWALIEELPTVDGLVEELSDAFRAPAKTVRADVLAFVTDLSERGFLV